MRSIKASDRFRRLETSQDHGLQPPIPSRDHQDEINGSASWSGIKRHLAKPHLSLLQERIEPQGPLKELWQERKAMYERHVDGLSTRQVLGWAWQASSDRLLAPRRWMTQSIFPIAKMAFNNAVGRDEDFRAERPSGFTPESLQLTSMSFITPDHAVIDGMRLSNTARQGSPAPNSRPTLVFVPPNGMIYEELLIPLCHLVHDYDLDVIAFNYRGVGKSLGELNRVDDAVTDTETVLRGACRLANKVGVLGLSIGGGTGAAALARMHREGGEASQHIDLFLAVHTFSSWREVHRTRNSAIKTRLFFSAAALLGMHDLAPLRLLEAGCLPERTVVIEAAKDWVIAPKARLGFAPRAANSSTVLLGLGGQHADLSFLRPFQCEPPSDAANEMHELLGAWTQSLLADAAD